MKEASITIKEIRSALKCDVALGHITKETYDHISQCLGLDWKEKQFKERNDMDSFLVELKELFERYNAFLYFQGQYKGSVVLSGDDGGWKNTFSFGDTTYFDSAFISLLPKMWERSKMLRKLDIPPTTKIEDIRPIFKAVYYVDRKSHLYVTDKNFKEMIKPYKPAKNKKNESPDKSITPSVEGDNQ